MSGELVNLTKLQAALESQHKYNPSSPVEIELKLIAQAQELLYRVLLKTLQQMNVQAVDVSDDAAAKAAAAAAANALRQALSAVTAEANTRAQAVSAVADAVEDERDARMDAVSDEADARVAGDSAENQARNAQFNAIPGYGGTGYGLSQNDFTDALKALLESALQAVATSGGALSGDGTTVNPLAVTLPAPPVPAAPTADGEYVLTVSGGVASWTVTGE
ncbi:MAG: hypothetical protein LBK23_10480 [Oscillospiraceae bacterium]|nr:hypothetical protein [Oscillospiraceae bacterium]